MPYIQRNAEGNICAVSQEPQPGFDESVDKGNAELLDFLDRLNPSMRDLSASDLDFVRVVEDVIELMIEKNLIRFTDLPAPAQEKMMKRRKLRIDLKGNSFDLFNDDEDMKLL